MSRFLASVETIAEARLAAAADIIDCKKGVFSPWDGPDLRKMAARFARREKSAVLGVFAETNEAATALKAAARLNFDYIKLGLSAAAPDKIVALRRFLPKRPSAVLVLFAEEYGGDERLFAAAYAAGFRVVMLDTLVKDDNSLFAKLPREAIVEFTLLARKYRLLSGLAGGLNQRHLKRNSGRCIGECRPDILGFRGALCGDGRKKLRRRKVEEIAYLVANHAKAAAGACLETSAA